jgi:CheY-like chemotaxis protein
LAIVRHLVELHGGQVTADSKGEGQGAAFTVKLPLLTVYQRESSEEPAHPKAGDYLSQIESVDRLDGTRILAVDDEPDASELLKTMIEESGGEVTIATSADEALNVLARGKFDIIVSDIGMPGKDGYQFMQEVRSLPANRGGTIPAVALTAYARTEDRLRALRAGYQMHVPKPIEYAELITVTASLVGRNHNT